MIYEHRKQPPISTRLFAHRMLLHVGFSSLLIGGSLAVGMAGYHWLARLGWTDAFLNACMLLGGMGPVGELTTTPGKLFAACFALYSGVVFLATTVIISSPVLHRIVHKFHWDADHAA